MMKVVAPLVCALLGQSFAAPALTGITVHGNSFVDTGTNKTVILRGVSHSSGEYNCVQGAGKVFEAPINAEFVNAIKSWGNNIVRIPLNEDCWLGINGASPAGSEYQKEVENFVKLLTDAGVAALLDLHWTADGGTLANKQTAMPDKSHAVDFWKSVAKRFASNPLALFEMYNEPFPDNGDVKDSSWACLQTGACTGAAGVDYAAVGMNDLVDAVRSTGATNAVLVSGLVWTNDLSSWLDHVPADPLNNLGAIWHSYDFNACTAKSCWEDTIAPVAAKFPIIVTESGFKIDYVQKLWPWVEQKGISYMAWTWNTWNGEGLITDWKGTPSSPWGEAWKSQLANTHPPSPSPPSGCFCCWYGKSCSTCKDEFKHYEVKSKEDCINSDPDNNHWCPAATPEDIVV